MGNVIFNLRRAVVCLRETLHPNQNSSASQKRSVLLPIFPAALSHRLSKASTEEKNYFLAIAQPQKVLFFFCCFGCGRRPSSDNLWLAAVAALGGLGGRLNE